MSALEVIEQFKALPQQEKSRVADFVLHFSDKTTTLAAATPEVHFATPGQVEAAGDKVLRQYDEVFHRLAQ